MYKANLHNHHNERGSILIFTVLLLGTMLTIALTLAAIFLPKIRTLTNAGADSVGAIYAADSGLEWCVYTNRQNPALPEPTMANGASYSIQPGDCTPQPMNNQVTGTYHGVSRSLQVTTP